MVITKENTEIKNKVTFLRINIDKSWTSDDFTNLFETLTILYRLLDDIENNKRKIFLDSAFYKILSTELSSDFIKIDGNIYRKLNYCDSFDNAKNKEKLYKFWGSDYFDTDRTFNDFTIKEIKYASPGFVDITGIASVISSFIELIKHYLPNKKQKLENELIELDIIEKQLAILQDLKYTVKDQQKILDLRNSAIRNLNHFTLAKKITSFELRNLER